jgi:hypothetical protein
MSSPYFKLSPDMELQFRLIETNHLELLCKRMNECSDGVFDLRCEREINVYVLYDGKKKLARGKFFHVHHMLQSMWRWLPLAWELRRAKGFIKNMFAKKTSIENGGKNG